MKTSNSRRYFSLLAAIAVAGCSRESGGGVPGVSALALEAPGLSAPVRAEAQKLLGAAAASFTPCLAVAKRDLKPQLELTVDDGALMFFSDRESHLDGVCVAALANDVLAPLLGKMPNEAKLVIKAEGRLSDQGAEARSAAVRSAGLEVCAALNKRIPAQPEGWKAAIWAAYTEVLAARGVLKRDFVLETMSVEDEAALRLAIIRSKVPAELASAFAATRNLHPNDRPVILLAVTREHVSKGWPNVVRGQLEVPKECAVATTAIRASIELKERAELEATQRAEAP
jgi:hypothetical protein